MPDSGNKPGNTELFRLQGFRAGLPIMKEASAKQGSVGRANARSRGATQQFDKPDWLISATDNFKFLESFRRPANLNRRK